MARKQSRKKATPNKGAADQRTAIADSAERGSGKAGYTEIIHTAGLHGVDVTVGEGDLLLADAAKVLPTNEFFNLTDSNWESSAPRSIIGQYLRRLADKDREVLQKQIDSLLVGKQALNRFLGTHLAIPLSSRGKAIPCC